MIYKSSLLEKKHRNKIVLFHRDYIRFQGGHLKVWHYFNHIHARASYVPQIYFTPNSIEDTSNPWNNTKKLSFWSPGSADLLFLAGLDWNAVLDNQSFLRKKTNIPVINLIQGLSHAEPTDIKYNFLSERAVRICVSPQVAEAIQSTGKVNGPVFIIPNGVDLSSLPTRLEKTQKDIKILIVAIKKPALGMDLEQNLSQYYENIYTITQLLPRTEFLKLLNRAKIVVCLPHSAEGFYLPALEAMALGALVVCPDCIGNRSFCLDGENCFSPSYGMASLLNAVHQANDISDNEKEILLKNAQKQVATHSLEHEKEQFLAIMDEISVLW